MSETEQQGAPRRNQEAPFVVGVDGSAGSRLALAWAVAECEAHGNPLLALGTYTVPPLTAEAPAIDSEYLESLERGCQETVEEAVQAVIGGREGLRVKVKVVQGPAAPALIDASADAALLVVGSRGRGGFSGLVLGSVSQQCAAHAHCPVVVVHERDANRARA